MPTALYLDTARMGRSSERTRWAQWHFLELAAEEGASGYFERFLRGGFEAWPLDLRERYFALEDWAGVEELKSTLLTLAAFSSYTRVLLAGRSSQLMKLGARALCRRARRVLSSDLSWPAYQRVLEREASFLRREIREVKLRDLVLSQGASIDEIIDLIVSTYLAEHCQGLFLPAVSHDGIRLPLERILARLKASDQPRFVLLDGAQSFCHEPPETLRPCDFWLTGTHKWLQGHYPMGIAFLPERRTQVRLDDLLREMLSLTDLDDPLLNLTLKLEEEDLDRFGETVNLAPIFSARAAATEALSEKLASEHAFAKRLRNRGLVSERSSGSGWRAVSPTHCLESGILLLEPQDKQLRRTSPRQLRSFFQSRGIALTAYDQGEIRLSMPREPFAEEELALLDRALRQAAGLEKTARPVFFP